MYLKRLKELREDRDLKQITVAEFLGMKQQQYSRYEKGINEIPFEYVVKLAKFYNVSIDYIAELTDNPKPYIHKKNIQIIALNFLRATF